MKKLTAILLALVLVLGMSSALAETPAPNGQTGEGTSNTCTITIYLPDARTVEDEMVEWSYPESIEADYVPAVDEASYNALVVRGTPKVEVTDYMILPTSKIKIGMLDSYYMQSEAMFNLRPEGESDDSTNFFQFTLSMGSIIEINKDTVDNEANMTRTFTFESFAHMFGELMTQKGTAHIIGDGPALKFNKPLTFNFYCVIEHPDA